MLPRVQKPPPPTARLQAVIFDMDGTLIDTERVAQQAWDLAQAETQIHLPQGFYETLIGRSGRDSHRRLLEVIGAEETVLLLMQRAAHHYLAVVEHEAVPLKPGARELLEDVQGRGLLLGLATSSERRHAEAKLGRHGLLPFFRVIRTGTDVTHSKPDPEIYLSAATALGVPPAHCLAIEDSPNGVVAAAAAGMPVALVPDMAPIPEDVEERAWQTFPDLHAVRAALTEILG